MLKIVIFGLFVAAFFSLIIFDSSPDASGFTNYEWMQQGK